MSKPERSNRDREWFSLGKSANDYPKDWIVIPVILAIEREEREIKNTRKEERATKDAWLREQLKIKIPFIKEQAFEEEHCKSLKAIESLTNTYSKTVKNAKVRVREETARKIKNIINNEPIGNSKFVYIGNIINKINREFLVKTEVQKE